MRQLTLEFLFHNNSKAINPLSCFRITTNTSQPTMGNTEEATRDGYKVSEVAAFEEALKFVPVEQHEMNPNNAKAKTVMDTQLLDPKNVCILEGVHLLNIKFTVQPNEVKKVLLQRMSHDLIAGGHVEKLPVIFGGKKAKGTYLVWLYMTQFLEKYQECFGRGETEIKTKYHLAKTSPSGDEAGGGKPEVEDFKPVTKGNSEKDATDEQIANTLRLQREPPSQSPLSPNQQEGIKKRKAEETAQAARNHDKALERAFSGGSTKENRAKLAKKVFRDYEAHEEDRADDPWTGGRKVAEPDSISSWETQSPEEEQKEKQEKKEATARNKQNKEDDVKRKREGDGLEPLAAKKHAVGTSLGAPAPAGTINSNKVGSNVAGRALAKPPALSTNMGFSLCCQQGDLTADQARGVPLSPRPGSRPMPAAVVKLNAQPAAAGAPAAQPVAVRALAAQPAAEVALNAQQPTSVVNRVEQMLQRCLQHVVGVGNQQKVANEMQAFEKGCFEDYAKGTNQPLSLSLFNALKSSDKNVVQVALEVFKDLTPTYPHMDIEPCVDGLAVNDLKNKVLPRCIFDELSSLVEDRRQQVVLFIKAKNLQYPKNPEPVAANLAIQN
jgi:hypothetical protein